MEELVLKNILDEHRKWLEDCETGSRAYLTGADLRGAYLTGAYLTGAYLTGAIGIYSFGPVGADRRIGYAIRHDRGAMFMLGCFWGTLAETRAAIVKKYGKNSLYEKQIVLAGKIVMETTDIA